MSHLMPGAQSATKDTEAEVPPPASSGGDAPTNACEDGQPQVGITGSKAYNASQPRKAINIPLDAIVESPNNRNSGSDVNDLVESIRLIGLLEPLVVRDRGAVYEVIAGNRRLRALRQLGRSEVPVTVLPPDDNVAALAQLDENLVRAALSKSEWAQAFAKQKALYETMHPETRHGGHRASSHNANLNAADRAPRFIEVASRCTGKSAATLNRLARIGATATAPVLEAWEAGDIIEADAAKLAAVEAEHQGTELLKMTAARVARKLEPRRPGSGLVQVQRASEPANPAGEPPSASPSPPVPPDEEKSRASALRTVAGEDAAPCDRPAASFEDKPASERPPQELANRCRLLREEASRTRSRAWTRQKLLSVAAASVLMKDLCDARDFIDDAIKHLETKTARGGSSPKASQTHSVGPTASACGNAGPNSWEATTASA